MTTKTKKGPSKKGRQPDRSWFSTRRQEPEVYSPAQARIDLRRILVAHLIPGGAPAPDLPAARLALARGIVAEAEPLALPLPGDGAVNPKPATWDDGERR